MRDKVLFYAFGILILIILGLNIRMYFLKKELNVVLQQQIDELELLKEQNVTKLDSIELLKKKQLTLIAENEKSLYEEIVWAKENNMRYEQIKKNIRNSNDADSLARQLTKRYSER
ncbi:hypothetical protein E6C50_17195 [Flavobacterium supellecticarium]|uniref:Uncharacterized protein n=1 Tax=Flavobacterium supellecticarium TaxID=2565924 RepID=A0A4V3W7H5_9FLAO|nr:hypothetical protein [Flavobacterium supellecticarium]THF47301.1 hypothetical protein E6C50_17195 [Flavobacterium supellecticarium]